LKKLASSALLVAGLVVLAASPAFGQKKDTLLLMRQLDTMQQSIANLQKTVDTQTAILRTLIEQSNDNVNSMKAVVQDLRKEMQQNLAGNNARFDAMVTQIQTLSESLEEAKARLSRLSDQVVQTQNILQTLHGPPMASAPTPGADGATAPTPAAIPDADALYKSGLSYFNGGQYDLAIQAFQEYLQYYQESDLASNAQFWIAECYFNQGNYQQAILEYDKCLERYPKGNKAAGAQLKKGYALLALDQRQAGVRELRSLIQRYPNAPESELARQRLKRLGATSSSRSGS
jgi:tol-pal system protein YbgF